MIVVPILLYPLLILGSSQAVQLQTGRMQREKILIGVPDLTTAERLKKLIDADNRAVKSSAGSNRGEAGPAAEDLIEDFTIYAPFDPNRPTIEDRRVLGSITDEERDRYGRLLHDDLRRAVQEGTVQVALIMKEGKTWDRWEIDAPFTLHYDSAEVRSQIARSRLERMLERCRARIREERISHLPETQRELFEWHPISAANVATPEKVGGSLLGHVLPFILVIMTITGAVYPAIDLTAGERERGTLETLMVAPVSVLDLIVGKFLVVAAVSLLAAALNVASIGMTLQFAGLQEQLLGTSAEVRLPLAVLPLIVLAMIPFAILFGAVLIAVASFARTFKEAQNYMMPVIMAALIPATAGALPGVELRGPMTVMPVANMVLLIRELLLGHFANWPAMLVALGSTCFYAFVAVVAAARLFGQEAVLFTDAGSWKTLFRRRFFPHRSMPATAHALLFAALLFPIWFHIQGQVGGNIGISAALIVVFFGMLPILAARYLKTDVRNTFSLRRASVAQWLGAFVVGLSSWAIAYELLVLQSRVIPMPEEIAAENARIQAQLAGWPLPLVLLALAIVPGVCEELTFRGFVLSGLRSGMRPAGAIFVSALIFAFFHFLVVRLGISCGLGVLLGYICWRTGSIGPAMLVHAMHNGLMLLLSRRPELLRALHLPDLDGRTHLPLWLTATAAVVLAIGIVTLGQKQTTQRPIAEAAELNETG
mgnify:CR=1 FL=1